MQADNIKRIAGMIIIIIAVLAMVLISRQVPFGAKHSAFHVENTDRIYRILISGDNREVELIRRDGQWFLDGDIEARKPAVDMILKILRDIRIKSPVSDELFNQVVDSDNAQHMEVRVYGKNRLIQSFHVYKNTEGSLPGIMKRRRATRPFIAHMPGEEADPAMYFIADREFWMPNIVFALSPEQISRVKVMYTDKPDSSFTIRKKGRQLDFYSPGSEGGQLDTLAAGRYLSYYNYIPFESYAYDLGREQKDSVSAHPADLSIEVVTDGADTSRLMAWTRKIMKGGSMVTDTDRLWGSVNGGEDLFVIMYYHLDPLIKYPSYFISE